MKVQGIYDFFSGYTLDGEANFNTLDIELKSPLQVSNSYLRHSVLGFMVLLQARVQAIIPLRLEITSQ